MRLDDPIGICRPAPRPRWRLPCTPALPALLTLLVSAGCSTVWGFEQGATGSSSGAGGSAGSGVGGSGAGAGSGASGAFGASGGSGGHGGCSGLGTLVFGETPAEPLVVPGSVSFMHVKAWGAGGNQEGMCSPPEAEDDGGTGGLSEAVFVVTPGDSFRVIVGYRGRAAVGEDENTDRFGFGIWGGGGLSGLFVGEDPVTREDWTRALLIAGGGGGASAPDCNPAGTGNHPTAAGGMPNMLGGVGADEVNGGGGGYRGGTGGAVGLPGKGGTGFVLDAPFAPESCPGDPLCAVDSVVRFTEPGTAQVPGDDDEQYDGSAGERETNGLVVVNFLCEQPGPLVPR